MSKAVLLALLAAVALTGCVVSPAYDDEGPGYYEEDYYGPDLWIFGGFEHERHERDREHFDRDAGHRGAESRRSAGHSERPAGQPSGHGGEHSGGGHEHR